MSARASVALVLGIGVALAGCAGRWIESGVYHSTKGYRVALPGADWTVADASEADLELRHRTGTAAMLANAQCERGATARAPDVLVRHLLIGVRDRVALERGDVSLNGWRAAHTVLDGRLRAGDVPTRIEAYVTKDERCVYDFVYAAPPASFDAWRAEFLKFVESFAKE